ncbi:Myb-like_DNA-binding domain-containing protein [Hexamita inflata]|uniref:Myb-like DNA-binding domain-containing protein n=1 Tax=Hexamita inflata TaxID=28002 RepID=A0AA86THB5_9EUKA|nr:Myb-like DNA-binding domain-containing protein [Hexamita inflata]
MKANRWTSSDCQNLLFAVESCKVNKRVDWNKVATYLPGRTPVQCKSQYTAKLHPKSEEHVNTVWDIDTNLLLSANAIIYNMDWRAISANIFKGNVSPDALRKQYMLNTVRINKNLKATAEYIIATRSPNLNLKNFTLYIFALIGRFRIEHYRAADKSTVKLPPIFDQLPTASNFLYSKAPEQKSFEPYYKIIETMLRTDEIIKIMAPVVEQDPQKTKQLCGEYDKNRANAHKLFM